MENLDKNELIERYLAGSLLPEERQAVENRLAIDEDFRAEVALHRQLQEEFADPQKLQLRTMLGDILRETPPPTTNYRWLKGLALGLAVLLGVWLGWHWLSPDREQQTAPAVKEEIKTTSPPIEAVDSTEIRNTPSQPLEKTPPPMAMADPKAFATNRDFEARLGSNIRATSSYAEMQSPALGANFTAQNGFVKINFRGTVSANNDTARYPLALKIYSNQPDAIEPLFQFSPLINRQNSAAERWPFSSSQRLRLQPGLYYFALEKQADEDLIFVGKFTVGAR